jgi:HD-like signal output (HDOD) protein
LIAKRLGVDIKTIEEFFIAGLLHDIGKVVLEHNLPDKYHQVIEKIEIEGYSFIEAEVEIIGLNHSQVGQMLAEKWHFSQAIEQVILHHHSPKECLEEHRKLVYSVSVANMFCNQNLIGNSGSSSEIYPMDEDLMSFLNLHDHDFDTLKPIIFDEIEKAHIFINAR